MNIFLFLIALSCGSQSPTSDEKSAAPEKSVAQPAKTVVATKPPKTNKPKGKIGGAPILSNPVVFGGISTKDVTEGIAKHQPAIDKCYTIERQKNTVLAGKVLVQFVIQADGTVAQVKTKATSLRHKPTEDCINTQVAKVTFPKLQTGTVAKVQFPFSF